MDYHVWIGAGAIVVLAAFFIWSFFIRVDPRLINRVSSDSEEYHKTLLPLDAQTQQYLGNDDSDSVQGPRPK